MIKFCPNCRLQFSARDFFCSDCSDAQGGPVALHAAPTSQADQAGIAIGAKSVVSGDVIARKDQHVYQGTANVTNILQVDETTQVHTCAICGIKGTIARGFHSCPGCGRTACASHFDLQARQCVNCRDAAEAVREDIYRQHAHRYIQAGNLVDPWQRQQLDMAQRSLGLSAVRGGDIEQSVRHSLPDPAWGDDEQRQLDAARHLLVNDHDPSKAVEYLEPLVERHPTHQELLMVWLEALAETDPERAMRATEKIQADIPAVYLIRARLLAERGLFQESLDLLAAAATKSSLDMATVMFIAMAAEVSVRRFLHSGNRLFLADAAAHLHTVAGSDEPYVLAMASWIAYLKGEPNSAKHTFAEHMDDLQVRRISRLAGPIADPATSTQCRIFRSHAHRTGAIWEPAPDLEGYVRIDDNSVPGMPDKPSSPPVAKADMQSVNQETKNKSGSKVFHRLAPTEVIGEPNEQ